MLTLLTASTPVFDWQGFLKVLGLALVFGCGVVVVLSTGIALYAQSTDHHGGKKALSLSGAGLCLLIVISAVAFGLYEVLNK